jgi:methanogenic corrinoid protein MtbC1
VADEHYCTAATQLLMSQLYPHIFATAKNGRTLVATCVSGDLHEIGVRMVADFFEMDGWNTFYLGANTPHAGVIATIIERKADVLAISATISYHVDTVRDLISAVRQHPECGHVRILAGGYPFNQDPELWRKIGADGFASDAQQAIVLADRLVEENQS